MNVNIHHFRLPFADVRFTFFIIYVQLIMHILNVMENW